MHQPATMHGHTTINYLWRVITAWGREGINVDCEKIQITKMAGQSGGKDTAVIQQLTAGQKGGGGEMMYPMIQQPATNKYQCGHLQSSTKCHKIVWVGPPSFVFMSPLQSSSY